MAGVVPFPRPQLPEASEEVIALAFAELRQNDLRYVAEQRVWMEWNGVTWRKDRVLAVFNGIRTLTRATVDRAIETGGKTAIEAGRIASARTVAAVERLAQADPRLAATPEIWDADPMLLATPAGYVDLATGCLIPARADRYATRQTLSAPRLDANACPRWSAFLDEITGGDSNLAAYLQRVAGYCLTGVTREHVLFFLLGSGRNGKSAFVSTLQRVMGEYAVVASMETLSEARGERHPTELAMLKGARLATALETDAGRHWAEAKVKLLTGGDPVTARLMRQDFFTYTPQFKLMIAGNQTPQIRTRDTAMQARLHIIPFVVTIPENRRDKTLQDRLVKEEAPGILGWAINGCRAWHETGLAPPQSVRDFTQSKIGDQDPIERWILTCCSRDPSARTPFADLYASWQHWAQTNGEFGGSEKAFATNLNLRNITTDRLPGSGAAARRGLALAARAAT